MRSWRAFHEFTDADDALKAYWCVGICVYEFEDANKAIETYAYEARLYRVLRVFETIQFKLYFICADDSRISIELRYRASSAHEALR